LDKTLVSLGQRDPKESSRGSKGNSGTWVDIYTSNPLYKKKKKEEEEEEAASKPKI
jgi:hypothetical protein